MPAVPLLPRRYTVRLLVVLSVLALYGCDATAPEAPAGDVVAGVDLDVLFAAPTEAERAAVVAEWAQRDVAARGVREEATRDLPDGRRVRIVSHEVGGFRHYGALIYPIGAAPGTLPVVVVAHGGDDGVAVEDALLFTALLGTARDAYLYAVPAFRAETLRFQGQSYRAAGPASPWDRDVDDALALMNVALQQPQAAPGRIGALGLSRGANVALQMGLRDPRIDLVVEYFGPTDFYGPLARTIVRQLLTEPAPPALDLPGIAYLNATYVQPLRQGTAPMAAVRQALLRRSPVYFAERLPDLLIHHGNLDEVVPVTEGLRLAGVMQELARPAARFEAHFYPAGRHDPATLPDNYSRTAAFLARLRVGL